MSTKQDVDGGAKDDVGSLPMKPVLQIVARSAVAHCTGLDGGGRLRTLHVAAVPWSGATTWTEWHGGKTDTHAGQQVDGTWSEFGQALTDCSQEVFAKSAGMWLAAAISTNGRCRDEDVSSITQICFDCDGAGDWDVLRGVLTAAAIAYLVQRSSSHTPDLPKWHVHIPLANSWSGTKRYWRLIYRHLVSWFSTVAGLRQDLDGEPPMYGFDHCTDRLAQPWFPSGRRSEEQLPAETICCVLPNAIDLEAFLAATGFDPSGAEAEVRANIPIREKKSTAHHDVPQPNAGASDESLMVLAFSYAGMLGPKLDGGKYNAQCPWEELHTSGTRFDSSTVIFPPSSGSAPGYFHCSHSHCTERSIEQVLEALPTAAIQGARVAIERRRHEKRNQEGYRPIRQPASGSAAVVAAETSQNTPSAAPFPPTDMGNAERLVARHGQDLRYCDPRRTWFTWTGSKWGSDNGGKVHQFAKETVRSIYGEAAVCIGEAERRSLGDHAKRSEKVDRVAAMISMARFEEGVPILAEQLDANPWVLNVQNGTLDLRSGALSPHNRADLLSKQAPVVFDARASCPRWLAFLDQIFDGNQGLIGFAQRAVGYSLTGDVSEHVLFFFYGTGANGKTTFLTTIQQLLGDYAKQGAPDLLLAKKNESHPTEQADLLGARLVVCTEIEAGRQLSEVTTKQLTGGDRVKARFMRQDFFEFIPTHKLFIAANHKPIVRQQDEGIWRRIRLVPFTVTVPSAQRDPQLGEKLKQELPGILNWALEGCLALQKNGLQAPKEVVDATGNYREEMDVIGGFINDCCTIDPNKEVSAKVLNEQYESWCRKNGERVRSQRTVGTALSDKGFRRQKSHGVIVWHGIGLQAPLLSNDGDDGGGSTGTNDTDTSSTTNVGVNHPHRPLSAQRPLAS